MHLYAVAELALLFYVVDYLIVVNGNALQQHISYLVYGASIFSRLSSLFYDQLLLKVARFRHTAAVCQNVVNTFRIHVLYLVGHTTVKNTAILTVLFSVVMLETIVSAIDKRHPYEYSINYCSLISPRSRRR